MLDRFRATLLALCTATVLTGPLAAQGRGADSSGAERSTQQSLYLRSVARVFHVAPAEAEVLASWLPHPSELPVLLHLAARTGASPDVVGSLRKSGSSWQRIASRLGIGIAVFHVEVGDQVVDGVLARPLAAFRSHPPSEWHALSLTDLEIGALVNVRVLADAASVSPAEMAALLATPAPDYLATYAMLLRTRSGTGLCVPSAPPT